jgi:hypothetical protein
MHRAIALFIIAATGCIGSVALAQRGGGGGRPSAPAGGRGGPALTQEEADRAANAKKWADTIEKARANAPPPPLPQIHFPSKNEMFLRSLCCVADSPRVEMTRYLDKLWSAGNDATARRAALEKLWQEAEKPKWARAAIEDFFRAHANAPLHPPAQTTPQTTPETTVNNGDARKDPPAGATVEPKTTPPPPAPSGPPPEPAELPATKRAADNP